MDWDEIAKDLKNLKIRHWHRVWEPFMHKYNCDHICELGVYRGENFWEIIRHNPKMAVAVDTWNNDGVHSPKDSCYTRAELDSQYEYFKSLVSSLPFVQIIRDNTVRACKRFANNYFDFVYIDADHSTDACYNDIIHWYPKVKPGKFLVGHDYKRGFGVVDAVNKFIAENKLELIFLSPSTWAVVKK